MDKRIICIGVVSVFLLAGLSAVSANEVTKLIPITENIENLEIYVGGFYSEADMSFQEDLNFREDHLIPHVSGATIYFEYEVVDVINHYFEEWSFKIEITYGEVVKEEIKMIYDTPGPDDSEKGSIEISFSNEELKSSVTSFFVSIDALWKDAFTFEEYWAPLSDEFKSGEITLENQAPNIPTIQGPSILKNNELGEFNATTTDPEADNIEYGWDLDNDHSVDKWTIEYLSGESCSEIESWDESGEKIIRVKARDTYISDNKLESDWSEPFTINIEKKSKIKENTIQSFLQRLFSSKFSFLFF